MATQDSPELNEFMENMRHIRNTSDYFAALSLIKTDLGLTEKVTYFEVEALLIFATRKRFNETLDADIVLSAFGLLKGFDNQHFPDEKRDSDELITARRKKFIRESSYVEDRLGSHNTRRRTRYDSYDELLAAGEDAIKKVINGLGVEDGGLIDKVAKKLYSYKRNGEIESYLNESRKYLKIEKDGKNEKVIGVILPELIHKATQNTENAGASTGYNPSAPSGPGQSPESTNKSKDSHIKIIRNVLCAFLIVLILVVLGSIFVAAYKYVLQKQDQETIDLSQMPSGTVVEIDETVRFNLLEAIYEKKTTTTVKIPDSPDGYSESVIGEEFTGSSSEPLD